MASNAQKVWIGESLNRIAYEKANRAINLTGKALPCSVVSVNGPIVTVNFLVNSTPNTIPNLSLPMFGPQYIRYPTQVGDLGVVFPCDVAIGVVSGLGNTATPTLGLPGNLQSLVFFPIGNANWSVTDDPNAVVIYGPDGVIIRDTAKSVTVTVKSGTMTVNGNLIVTGNITYDSGSSSIGLATHTHSGITTGSGNSGPPTPGT
jgi:hypothetical protein